MASFKKLLRSCLAVAILGSLCLANINAFAQVDTLKTQALAAHNTLRARHHAPALVWDNTLASFAVKYASKCQFRHSGSGYGENLAQGYPSIAAAVNAWYAERQFYSYQHPGFSMQTGHFTQLVWKSTKKLGCGYAQCYTHGRPWGFLVCEYSPAGNIVNRGYFQENVVRAG